MQIASSSFGTKPLLRVFGKNSCYSLQTRCKASIERYMQYYKSNFISLFADCLRLPGRTLENKIS